jgi:2-polyprenyl-3-methyl-5-hydroxy-6-metoxy-1,4-benzoquinol methylase
MLCEVVDGPQRHGPNERFHNGCAMKEDDRPQNVYDDPQFFAGYAEMERFRGKWGAAMEHRSFDELVGDAAGQRVLDLGCGSGQLALHLAEAGASEVLGIDASERMLEVARARRGHPRVSYRRMAMEEADFKPGAFDMVVSSLAFHYVHDYAGLVERIVRWLRPGGVLVYSTEHPIFTARATPDGWVLNSAGARTAWAIDHYAEEAVREHSWFVSGVRRYHRTLATLLNVLIDRGLTIERVVESTPSAAWLRGRGHDSDERRRPLFLLVRARKT